ncbi:MAG: hypothetical protein DHS20C15_10030 [Planctomycetota bacterium]|nr:MAG: hypothetical protein DHS20C15_10030 [Planctomycetota bacterium]
MDAPPFTNLAGYRLLGLLAQREHAVLWHARDARGRACVFKLHEAGAGEAGGLNELQLLGLEHPGLASCHDAGRVPGDGRLFTVTRYFEGVPLDERALADASRSASAVEWLAAGLFSALDALHSAGFLHRDLKAQNVQLERQSSRPVLLDFGLSCALTQASRANLAGTPGAFAPELFAGAQASVASELWAAGQLLLEACVGRAVFRRGDPEAMQRERAAFTSLPAELAERVPSRDVRELLGRLLAPDPGARPESAEAALYALPLEDSGPGSGLLREGARARWHGRLAAQDPACVGVRDAAVAGRVHLRLLRDAQEGAAQAHARLLARFAHFAEHEGELGLTLKLAAERRALGLQHVLHLARRLAAEQPFEAAFSAECVSDDARAMQQALQDTPGVTVSVEAAPAIDALVGEVERCFGAQPVLVQRLRASPPASWSLARAAVDELLRADVIAAARNGARLDEARLPAAWPELARDDPAAACSRVAREVLGVLALAGRPLSVALLEACCDAAVAAALSELQGAGLVSPAHESGELRWQIADERQARRVLQHLDPSTRARRLLAADLAEYDDADPAEPQLTDANAGLVAQILRAPPSDPDDAATTQRLLAAARSLRRQARLELAEELLVRGLQGLPESSSGRAELAEALHLERLDVLIRAGDDARVRVALDEALTACGALPTLALREARLAQLAGRSDEALEGLHALDLDAFDTANAVLGLQLRAELRREQGDVTGALADLREGLRRAGPRDNRRSMVLLERLGGVMTQLGRHDDAVRSYERCVKMARALGHEALVWSPMNNMARVIQSRGEWLRGLALQERAAQRCELSGDRRSLWTVLNSLGARWLLLGRVDRAGVHLTRALQLAREQAHTGWEAISLNNNAAALAMAGRHDDAEQDFERSLALRRERGDTRSLAAVHLTRGPLRLGRGLIAGAQFDLDTARAALRDAPSAALELEADLLAARLAWEARDEAATIASAERALGRARELGFEREHLIARDLLARGGGRSLEDLAASDLQRGPWLAPLLLTRAEARADAGQWVEACEDMDLAFSVLSELPEGTLEAECLVRRLTLDLDRAARLLLAEDPEFVEVGALLSRVPRDLDRAEHLVRLHGLQPLQPRLEQLAQRHAELEEGDDMTGLSALAGRLRDLERLVEINKQLNSERDTQKLLEVIIDSAVEITGAARGFLILFDGKAEEIRAARNIDESSIQNPEFQISHSVARSVAREGRPLLTANAIDDPKLGSTASISELKLLSILCVPLSSRSGSLGAVYLDHPQVVGRFDESHLGTVTALTEQAAIALENARLSEGLERSNRELSTSREEIARLNEALQERLQRREAELEQTRETLDASLRAEALRYDYANIITRSPRMHEALDLLDRVTDTDFPVVIHGESGTGKELMARACHFNGSRKSKSFLTINCAAIPEHLIESELFGAKKGAFTGADRDRKGLFAQAHEGTLFLDEIGDMSPSVQTRLLRVLQEGEFLPVGGREVVKVDVRILCATHRDLTALVEEGAFREDLYFRLAVGRLDLPPLRERSEDIAPLLEHFLERHGSGPRSVDPEALSLLRAQPWPGNVRELENLVMNLLIFDREGSRVGAELVARVLGPKLSSAAPEATGAVGRPGASLKERLEAFERAQVEAALEAAGHVKAEAARQLKVSIRTFYKMLKRLGFEDA